MVGNEVWWNRADPEAHGHTMLNSPVSREATAWIYLDDMTWLQF